MTRPAALLGGRVAHVQAADGHRTGIEPVLLAASVPARAGQRVLEGGAGSGAALLCLAWRCPGIVGVGVERDAGQAAVARANLAANGRDGLRVIEGDLTRPETLAGEAPFDHAMANPPWHLPGASLSPDTAREAARRAPDGLLASWIAALARHLRPRGTLTLVVAAARAHECLAAMAASGCGSPGLLPLWPRAGRPAKLVLLASVRGGRGPMRVLPGLVLHDGAGYSAAAEAVLRDGAALDWLRPARG